MELLLFDDAEELRPTRAIDLEARKHRTYHYWHVFLPEFVPASSTVIALLGLSHPSTASVSIRARFCSTRTGGLSPCLMDILARWQANTG